MIEMNGGIGPTRTAIARTLGKRLLSKSQRPLLPTRTFANAELQPVIGQDPILAGVSMTLESWTSTIWSLSRTHTGLEDGAWSPERKRQYANDLSYEGHLIATKASANRSKGSDGPEDWRPPDRSYWCQYAIDWVTIKETWELTASSAEADALAEMLKTCAATQTLVVVLFDEVQPVASPLTTPNLEDSYGSCDVAEAAGESRVPGTKGSGRGFPKDKVPTARDGDGDGVVCER